MKINAEDVVQAALKVERWCKVHGGEDCPFFDGEKWGCRIRDYNPCEWGLEEFLRTRGMKRRADDEIDEKSKRV